MGVYKMLLPDVGEGIAEAEVVEWNVKPGDLVREDDILAAVMTDKAAVEVPSVVDGKVLELGCEIGQMMPVGAVLIRIEVDGNDNLAAETTASDSESRSRSGSGSGSGSGSDEPDVQIIEEPIKEEPKTTEIKKPALNRNQEHKPLAA